MTRCLASCRTETVLSSVTAIQFFNMFLFAVITGWNQCPWPWFVSFLPHLSSLFFLNLIFSHDLSEYITDHFYDHLCNATTDFLYEQGISNEHPALELLHYLETTAYDDLSEFKLGRHVMYSILRWANMLICHPSLEVDAPYLLCFHFSDPTS